MPYDNTNRGSLFRHMMLTGTFSMATSVGPGEVTGRPPMMSSGWP